jgi:hypothetical protein
MKSVLPLFLFGLICSGFSRSPLTPEQIEAQVQREGGRATIDALARNEAVWGEILSDIESGQSKWLHVALLLKPFSDAGFSEDLNYSVALALSKAPRRVLALIGHGFKLEEVCTSPFNEPEPGIAESYEQKALKVLAMVREPSLKELAAQCAQLVKSPPGG